LGVTVEQPSPFGGFAGPIHIASEDVNGDGRNDLIFSPGLTGGPNVIARDYVNLTVYQSFLAFQASFRGGVFVG
jgi:hypothetical protein